MRIFVTALFCVYPLVMPSESQASPSGAFGYEFGQVFEGYEPGLFFPKYKRIEVMPPIPDARFSNYKISLTKKDKKIYKITASKIYKDKKSCREELLGSLTQEFITKYGKDVSWDEVQLPKMSPAKAFGSSMRYLRAVCYGSKLKLVFIDTSLEGK